VLTKRISLNPNFGFLTNHTNLTKRCREELTKAYGWVFSLVELAPSNGGRVGSFYSRIWKTSHRDAKNLDWSSPGSDKSYRDSNFDC
jgi:hypothetical protein